ncbi:class I SAM-dependent methyltransferase [Nonomuraea sp. MG754425]|uniref:class I SAM-dependent methyltransferase n=1 Tax=Nonomuraea sp. MG754425 TaxID=2570319 RepID=UPI001F221AD0|nr:class I SAM-dependent methyltransferase [Nonomuraea sp. MG754425]MCF6468995.1 class I SAM-dependent methyltransferase [Nonomuraea sp. MG754425]
MREDACAVAVPFYDLWHGDGHVPMVRELLPPLLAGVRRSVVEIGAGTGLITELIARETPAEIYAVEPSLGMRSVLLSRLAADPGLLRRVTVLPCGALDLEVDEPVEAVVMISVLQSFAAAGRAELWRVLRDGLEPGGRLVFNWRDRAPAVPGDLEVLGSYQVGRHTYAVAGQVLAAEGERVTSRFVYRVERRGTVLSADEVITTAHWPAGHVVAAELKEAGFEPGDAPAGMQVWHAAGPAHVR